MKGRPPSREARTPGSIRDIPEATRPGPNKARVDETCSYTGVPVGTAPKPAQTWVAGECPCSRCPLPVPCPGAREKRRPGVFTDIVPPVYWPTSRPGDLVTRLARPRLPGRRKRKKTPGGGFGEIGKSAQKTTRAECRARRPCPSRNVIGRFPTHRPNQPDPCPQAIDPARGHPIEFIPRGGRNAQPYLTPPPGQRPGRTLAWIIGSGGKRQSRARARRPKPWRRDCLFMIRQAAPAAENESARTRRSHPSTTTNKPALEGAGSKARHA